MSSSIQISYDALSQNELSENDRSLVLEALKAMELAHAPYSKFLVGSSLRLKSGKIIAGNNQENAAYPSGLCAERVALFKAMSENSEPIECILVLAQNSKGEPANAFSCGSCRQVMMEYASMQEDPIRIIMRNSDQKFIIVNDVKALLPFNFDSSSLISKRKP